MTRPRVLLCSLDGVRPDAIHAARTPVIDALAAGGAVKWDARTVMPSVTLPCHTSMLRGVDVPRHGITTNTFIPLARPVPSLIDVAATQGRRCGFFYNWEPLRDLAAPGSLTVGCYLGDAYAPAGDRLVAEIAVREIHRYDLDLVFVYFGHPDEAGHKHGWMTAPYIEAIENADACLGEVIQALKAADRWEETTTLVIADHGGHERSHGTEMPEDMTIPFVLHGRGVNKGHAIDGPVRIFDACTTLAHCLGLTPDRTWDGAVIHEALT